MIRPTLALPLAGLLAAGCTPAPPPSRSAVAARAACRAQTEAAYNRQNRDLLSTRDTTDTPFSSSGVSGITTTGLSREYDRETTMDNCLRGSSVSQDTTSGGGSAVQAPAPTSNLPGK